jgi:hypothetical protein
MPEGQSDEQTGAQKGNKAPGLGCSRQLVMVVVTLFLIVELRHIVQAIIEVLAGSGDVLGLITKIWTLNDATLVGILFLCACAYWKLREHLDQYPLKLLPSRFKISKRILIGMLFVLVTATAGYSAVYLTSLHGHASFSARDSRPPHLVSCLHRSDCQKF